MCPANIDQKLSLQFWGPTSCQYLSPPAHPHPHLPPLPNVKPNVKTCAKEKGNSTLNSTFSGDHCCVSNSRRLTHAPAHPPCCSVFCVPWSACAPMRLLLYPWHAHAHVATRWSSQAILPSASPTIVSAFLLRLQPSTGHVLVAGNCVAL